jgi:hypothetical protein
MAGDIKPLDREVSGTFLGEMPGGSAPPGASRHNHLLYHAM